MKKTFLAAFFSVVTLQSFAGTVSEIVSVPAGMYAHSDNPPCGIESPISQIGQDANTTKAIALTFGPNAAALVVVISEGNKILEKSGGDLGPGIRGLTGQKDWASCAIVCLRLPSGKHPKLIILSDRHGADGLKPPIKNGSILVSQSTGDYSGWRDVVSATSSGRWMTCATATNWSHNQAATKRIEVRY